MTTTLPIELVDLFTRPAEYVERRPHGTGTHPMHDPHTVAATLRALSKICEMRGCSLLHGPGSSNDLMSETVLELAQQCATWANMIEDT